MADNGEYRTPLRVLGIIGVLTALAAIGMIGRFALLLSQAYQGHPRLVG